MNMLITTPFGKHPWTSVSPAAVPDADQSRSKECRARAKECQEIADRSPGLIKEQYRALALQWLVIAEQADRQSKRRPP